MGDGIMALFGAPLAHEDHTVRACYAALRMQEAIKRYADEVRRTHGAVVKIRVGLNSGEVVVRAIGSDLRMDYTAVGQTTHLAARMEQLAAPGSIVLAPDTLRLAEGYVAVKPLGPVKVKGLSEPVEVYEVISASAVRTRFERSAARGFTRFVGRDAEMEQLRGAFERAGGGHGQVVAVVGEPGVGKSRLFYEFVHSHRFFRSKGDTPPSGPSGDWLVVESGSVSYATATPYLPMIDLLKAYFQIDARDDGRTIREKVTDKLLTLDETLRPLLPALLALLDVPVEDRDWQVLDPLQRRRHTHEAIKRLLLRESQRQPLCLVFEDLHWVDAETQAVLDGLIESLPAARLLLLLNYRPEYRHPWGSKTYYSQARIDPLPEASATELLGALLGADPSTRPLTPLLIERTEGNPFFLEESVRTLVETGMLAGEPGRYRLARPLGSIEVPATVQAVLAARIDRLPPQAKSLLQSASVVGKDVPFEHLRAIAELPEEALREGLAHLQAAEFLYETRLFPDLEYTFKHALTHEVAYTSVLHERRRALHARIVEAIETLSPDRLGEHVERLAQHALRGEVWPKAVAYLRQAAAKAVARSANREAVSCLEQALGALRHLPRSPETREQAIDLRFGLRLSLMARGEFGRMLEYLREAEALAEALDDRRRLGQAACYIAYFFWAAGEPDRAIGSGQRALRIATALEDFALQVATNFYLGQVYHALGDYRQAIESLARNVAALKGERLWDRCGLLGYPSMLSRSWLARCFAEVGEFAEGLIVAEEGVRIAEEADHQYSRIFAYFGLGFLSFHKGELQRAISMLERALNLCQLGHIPLMFPRIASVLGSAYVLSARVAEALPLLEQAVEQTAPMKIMADHALWVAGLSEGNLLAGHLEQASNLAGRALALSRTHKEQGNQAWIFRLLGEVGSHSGPRRPDDAKNHYQAAIELATALGMRPLVAHCHLGLGKLYRRTGKREQAQEHLTTATTMYSEMDMRFWLERAEAEMRDLA